MKTIHKQVLQIVNRQCVHMPQNCNILNVKMQANAICMWYECDHVDYLNHLSHMWFKRTFVIVGTGKEVPDEKLKYINTVQDKVNGIYFVWHVYEKLE